MKDQPLEYLFGFNYEYVKVERVKHPLFDLSYLSGNADAPMTFKQVILPYSAETLLVRFENIGDKLDRTWGQDSDGTYYVDVHHFAELFYQHMNGHDSHLSNINIIETTLSGNQNYQTMRRHKVTWRGVDDDVIVPPVLPEDKPGFVIALPRQRIRMFYIEYVPYDYE